MVKAKFPNGLRRAMDAKAIGVTALGRLVGEPKQNIDRWRKGEQRLKPEMAQKIAPHLDTDVNALLQIPLPDIAVREVGQVGAGGSILDVDEITADTPMVEIVAGEPVAAARISGVSLGMFEGWLAIFGERDSFHEGLYGELCIVETNEGETLIKWVEQSPGGGLRLRSGDGSIHADGIEVRWAARVLGVRPPR